MEYETWEGRNFNQIKNNKKPEIWSKVGRWSEIHHPLTAICLLCFSIQGMRCNLIRATASYHRDSAASTPEGGHWLFPPSASGARMFESILQSAWWNSLFRLLGERLRGFAFATKEADAFSPPSVLTWQLPYVKPLSFSCHFYQNNQFKHTPSFR